MGNARENCGFCVTHTLHDVYSFGRAIQHRGREAAGIAAISNDRIDVLKWEGAMTKFDITDLHKIFPGNDYHTYLGHVRYATRGRKDRLLEEAHPHTIGGKEERRGDHVLILDCEAAIVQNGQVNSPYLDCVDKSKLKTDCDTEALLYFFKEKGEKELLRQIPGSYTMAIADKKKVIVMRDRTGIKPGALGWKDGKYVAASEDIAFRKNGGELIEDLRPGAFYYLSPDSRQPKPVKVVEPQLAYDFFEWNYIADVDSIINSLGVRILRAGLGEAAAEEFDLGADLVTYIPRCPEVAARSYARKLGLEFLPVFYKMRGERSFLGSTSEQRADSISRNLFPIPGIEKKIENKTLVILDDSFIRGNVLGRISEIIRSLSVKKAYIISYTPPIGIIREDGASCGCFYGVDMPPDDRFIIRRGNRNKTSGEISRECDESGRINVDYLSLEGMLRTFERLGMPRENLCTRCIGGELPF